MRIISWNVNGIRAVAKKDKWQQIFDLEPDIICLQETKAEADQIPEEVRNPKGWHSYFDHSKGRKGYSGTAIYSKVKPEKVQFEMGNPTLDSEGRLIATFFKDFVLVNVYFPNGGGGPERLKYKLDFYDHFLKYIEMLRKTQKHIIFTGDVNTAHKEIDLARPKENVKNTGFLPIERAWIDQVIAKGYVDTYRRFFPTAMSSYTYWDQKTFARERNVGWRIDYFFTTPEVVDHITETGIFSDIYGSDHCPIFLDVDLKA